MADFARSADPAVQAELDRLDKLSPGRDVLGLERITAFSVSDGTGQKPLTRLAGIQIPDSQDVPTFLVPGPDGMLWAAGSALRKLRLAADTLELLPSPRQVLITGKLQVVAGLLLPMRLWERLGVSTYAVRVDHAFGVL